MSDVSVIGLGVMGSALARTLLESGRAVTVWNRTAEKAEPLAAAGADVADTAAAAVAASPATIVCIASHDQTIELLSGFADSLRGKTIIELSTGGAEEAEALAKLLSDNGAAWLVGIINAYPTQIGGPETVLSMVGDTEVWETWQPVIKTLGGAAAHFGTEAGMAAALFAALFTTRQGFMFGMIYGAMICEKAGVSMDTYVEVLPLTIRIVQDYYELFAATVPKGDFTDPPASLGVYHAAFEDVMKTCRNLQVPDELPELLHDLLQKGVDAGLADRQITSLTRLLADEKGSNS